MNDLHVHVFAKHFHYLPALVEPEQPGIDKHAGQLVADRLVNQRGGHARINTSTQAQYHLLAANLLANTGDRLRHVLRHVPVDSQPQMS